jgi:hypothetical protein
MTQWFRKNVSVDTIVVGPDYLLTPLSQKAFPFYGFNNYFVDKDTAREDGIEYILFDDYEWASYCNKWDNGFESHLENSYTLAARINYVSIYKLTGGE